MMTEGTSRGLAQHDHTPGLATPRNNPIALGTYESALISATGSGVDAG